MVNIGTYFGDIPFLNKKWCMDDSDMSTLMPFSCEFDGEMAIMWLNNIYNQFWFSFYYFVNWSSSSYNLK